MWSWDRLFRVFVGFAIMGYGIVEQSWWGLLAIVPWVIAIKDWCPIKFLGNKSSCSVKDKDND